MNKMTKILFAMWIILAIACFVGAFFIPVVWIKVLGLVFGAENMMIILAWVIGVVQGMVENKRLNSVE